MPMLMLPSISSPADAPDAVDAPAAADAPATAAAPCRCYHDGRTL